MDKYLLVVHLFGIALWLGSMLAVPCWAVWAARRDSLAILAFICGGLHRLHLVVTLPGYVLTLASGIGLAHLTGRSLLAREPIWLAGMQGIGYLLVVALIGLGPLGRRLARLSAEAHRTGRLATRFTPCLRAHTASAVVTVLLLIVAMVLGAAKPL